MWTHRLRLGPRSEEWRLQWGLRSATSVAACAFIFFFVPTKTALAHYTDASFTVFVAALVKDVTLGATIMNIWACIMGSLIATVTVQVIYSVLAANFEGPEDFPVLFLLIALFMTVFSMQFMELPLMGKRLGVSLLALNLVSFPSFPDIPVNVWRLYLSVVIGCACGVVGAVLPLPVRLAGVEVEERMRYCCNTICDLLRQDIAAWVFEPSKAETIESLWQAQAYPTLEGIAGAGEAQHSATPATQPPWLSQATPRSPARQRWRKVRVVFSCLHAIKHGDKYGVSWIEGRQVFGIKDRHARAEMLVFLHEQLDTLLQRNQQARFERPSRTQAILVFARYVNLLRTLLMTLRQLEHQVLAVDRDPHSCSAFMQFFRDPNFRRALFRFVDSITRTLVSLFALVCQKCQELRQLAEAIVHMQECKEELNRVYFVVRSRVFYGVKVKYGRGGRAKERMSLHAETPDSHGVEEVPPHTGSIDGNYSVTASGRSVPVGVCFILNTVLFLLDSVCDSLVHFYSPDELSAIQLSSCCGGGLYKDTWGDRVAAWRLLVRDFIPDQTPAHFIRYDGVKRRYMLIDTPQLRHRALNAFVVALAMTLAACYGILNERKQPALASFTIAYLAGFPVSGMNIMTSVNRAAGTVLACIYVIFVVLLYSSIPEWAYALQAFLLAGAAVVFQIPATYVRSFPLPSYGGTVAAFTAALLLFSPDPTVDQSIRRILDTFVGVGIFMSIELFFFAQSSEAVLMQDMGNVLRGVQRQFLDFHSIFKALNSHGSNESDILASTLSAAQQFDQISIFLARQRDLMPFYKTEPRILSAPSLPDRLLQQLLTHEHQAAAAMQMMRYVLDKVRLKSFRRSSLVIDDRGSLRESLRLPAPEPLAGRLRSQDLLYYYSQLSLQGAIIARDQSDIEMAPSSVDSSMGGTIVASMLADFDAFLLPLQPQFVCVEQLVSGTVLHLAAALAMLQGTGKGSVLSSDYSSLLIKPEDHSACVLELICSVNRERFLRQMKGADIFPQDKAPGATVESDRHIRYHSLFFGETRGVEVEALFKKFSDTASNLQQSIHNRDALDGSDLSVGQLASNDEVKLVATLLHCTQDLLVALQNMAKVISRLQAARDIAVTQSGV